MDKIDILINIALDLTSALNAESRYQRLLDSLHRVIPYDAAALLRIERNELYVKASKGLSEDAKGRRFLRKEHPRLDIICSSREPVRFPADAKIPDPFDGLLADEGLSESRIHSCLGCPLFVGDTLMGALTADAVDPEAFDDLDLRFLSAIGALAGAEMHTTDMMKALEVTAEKTGLIARDLMQDFREREGRRMVGEGEIMARLRREIELVAGSDFPILVTGETGTGKELVAREIHALSRRSERPILYLNCANLTETLAESELFGHTKGSFTGAVNDRTGKFELADGGTLFLDEVGELPLSLQPRLLRVLQEGEVQKIGSSRIHHVDVRLISATNRNLEREVVAGRFRADLYHRLNVYPLHVPPLRERTEDIPLLAGYFCQKAQRRLGMGTVRIHEDAIEALKRYPWPGNVRELENVITRAVLRASSEVKDRKQVRILPRNLDLGPDFTFEAPPAEPECDPDVYGGLFLREAVDAFQKMLILRTVEKNQGNWAATAKDLGIHRSNLYKLAVRLKIK
ncbi:MAG: nitric oxide reductase transcriptional regulator NorR [Desulfobacteraceae bacterium]|nr:MAG: nitric oxide reductase transcriptional regulator NorR [Desulfobacteraceae bacterium]